MISRDFVEMEMGLRADVNLSGAAPTIEYVGDFQLSVTRALRDQLLERLHELEPVPLTLAALESLERRGGVYQLFDGDELVYVGKSTRDLPGRLSTHMRKLSGRKHDILARVSFKCVYVSEDLDALAPEKMLIGTLRQRGLAVWNSNGFGNKDPGKQRDTSLVESGHFDRQFPIDLDLSVSVADADSALTLASRLKAALPYTFRFPTKGVDARSLEACPIPDPVPANRSAGDWMSTLADAMPPGWVIVALPGYVIAYPSISPESYASRTGAWVSTEDGSTYSDHTPEFSSKSVPVDDSESAEPEEDEDART